jgi:hypothetical protein
VVVRVRPVLPHESSEPVAVACAADGRKVQVRRQPMANGLCPAAASQQPATLASRNQQQLAHAPAVTPPAAT